MEKTQLCNVCRKNIGYYVCKKCGKSICQNCYSEGVCMDCTRGKILK